MRNAATASAATVPDARKAPSARPATSWWQWMLLYPSFLATLLTAVPTWADHIQAFNIGVKAKNLAESKEQNRLWETNLPCARDQEIQPIRTARNIDVGARVCPSGDVLLLIKRPTAEQATYRWVSTKTFEQDAGLQFLRPAAAYAAPREIVVAQIAQGVLNQRWLRPGMLKQRVRQGGGCVDLVINTYTGSVQSQVPVACATPF